MKLNPKGYPIDLNADLGEGGTNDEALLQLITSANIACGGHAGDQSSMQTTVKIALASGVNIGAHPSFPDRENFGRQPMIISDQELSTSLNQQIGSLKAVCSSLGAKLFHVKPHGALYNQAAFSERLGQILINAIKRIDPSLKLMILAASPLVPLARQHGLTVIEEAFADRTYLADGSLAPRTMPGAIIEDDNQSIKQVEQVLANRPLTTLDGSMLQLKADSICLHGDNEHALRFAQKIAEYLKNK
ncbi:5-oxoprolinase subunit PxpA [Shewanella psychropiezotolerans]|uniref:5-oxoprolinase subunit PxpA n=1 Tax=Shewanella psychropiezotolerans TaxID=2593655 RepID=A0ABX5WW09_9GAMM|nr:MULTISPECIES: 5-oxoprolinase subunit PxpA [Shewanella]MPY26385.1 5-oxoprolinase subunit PxpA [Shewanella sp. YLB-07]QDO81898.1 5-oxoprolinase subunit PxpA [Shewanella psychropiezotolerans]